jgi:deoxyribose-phosphate aldolase
LTDEEKARAGKIAQAAKASFVMTATGFAPRQTIAADVQLLRATCPDLKIRAAGGIETQAAALEMIGAGAERVMVREITKVL